MNFLAVVTRSTGQSIFATTFEIPTAEISKQFLSDPSYHNMYKAEAATLVKKIAGIVKQTNVIRLSMLVGQSII